MNYIILDLEWNQCPDGKEKENKDLPFEIIEIGAVKLDSDRHYLDSFERMVAPKVYRSLHHITKDIVHTSMKELMKGADFMDAAKDFFAWCGEDYIFCTWGSMDLVELQRNCRFYNVEYNFPMPFIFYDLQKSYSLCYDDGKSRVSLETAITEMNIEKDLTFHSAMSDARYTAKVFELMDFDKVKDFTSLDLYDIPASRKEEITMCYPTYSKFVSMGYEERETLLQQSYLLCTKCYLCGKTAKKKIKWFSSNQRTYYCVAKCDTHGLLKGRMKIKKTDDGRYFAIKILKLTDENGVASIRDKQLLARAKRRERRHREREKLHD